MVPCPIVVAAPRSGFSLLIQITNTLLARHGRPGPVNLRGQVLRRLADVSSAHATQLYRRVFEQFGITSDLVFNGEFHKLVGGPKWVSEKQPERACIRKYFGVRGQGDFLLVTSHPREALEYDPVIHSHTAPRLWLEQPYYDDCLKLTSIRNPIGIINSASFSLNAMASEYVQKFMPRVSETFLRQRLALYKLTDLDFVRGLVKFLKGYLDQYLPVRDKYHAMRWEDLLTEPVRTIQTIGTWLGLEIDANDAAAIWQPMDHVNLLQFHKHNYRQGKGIVGDWKNSLVNEHMDIFREFGFDRYLADLGYPPIPEFDPRDYSPYQRLVANYLRRGEIYRCTGDENLFNFAFNKSNIDASSFNFKSFPQRKWTRVERSCLANDDIVLAVSDVAEQMCSDVNSLFDEALALDVPTTAEADRALADLTRRSQSLFEDRAGRLPVRSVRGDGAPREPMLSSTAASLSGSQSEAVAPSPEAPRYSGPRANSPVLDRSPELLLVNCEDPQFVMAFAAACSDTDRPLPSPLSHDWQRDVAALLRPEQLRAEKPAVGETSAANTDNRPSKPLTCLADFIGLPLDPVCLDPSPPASAPEAPCEAPPRLVEEGRRGFNIVEFQGKYFALAQSLGPLDVAQLDDAWLADRPSHDAIVKQVLADVIRQIDELVEPSPVAPQPTVTPQTPPEMPMEMPLQAHVPVPQPRWLDAIRPRLGVRLSQILSRLPGGL